jgi:hypothetical protein
VKAHSVLGRRSSLLVSNNPDAPQLIWSYELVQMESTAVRNDELKLIRSDTTVGNKCHGALSEQTLEAHASEDPKGFMTRQSEGYHCLPVIAFHLVTTRPTTTALCHLVAAVTCSHPYLLCSDHPFVPGCPIDPIDQFTTPQHSRCISELGLPSPS